MTDNEIIKALDRLEKTKDYLRELYREQVKKCPYPELKPLAKQTYEDNKNAFNIAIKAIEENIRQKAEIEELRSELIITKNNFENAKERYDEAVKIGQKMNEKLIDAYKKLQTAKSEAYKEFAERLKEGTFFMQDEEGFDVSIVYVSDIDRTLKKLSEVSDNA